MPIPPQKHSDIHRVLVIGPNGNMGSHLIPKLLALGYTVRALQFNSPVEARAGLEVVMGHTLDLDSLKRAVQGVDAVYHLIRAGTGPGENSREKWFNCCVRGAVNLLEACREVPIKRLVAGSADNVFGHTQNSTPRPDQ